MLFSLLYSYLLYFALCILFFALPFSAKLSSDLLFSALLGITILFSTLLCSFCAYIMCSILLSIHLCSTIYSLLSAVLCTILFCSSLLYYSLLISAPVCYTLLSSCVLFSTLLFSVFCALRCFTNLCLFCLSALLRSTFSAHLFSAVVFRINTSSNFDGSVCDVVRK